METQRDIEKQVLADQLHRGGSPLTRYATKVLGSNKGLVHLLQYELCQLLLMNLGGGIGYLLRRIALSSLFKACGKKTIFGRALTLRGPGNISLGENVAIDDQSQLDGGTGEQCSITLGKDVVISKGCVIQAKTGPLAMGEGCDIGAHCIISSVGGIVLENNVLIAGNCYIGGARYHMSDMESPIMYQGIFTRGPITIGEGSWIGASVTVLDGVTIGRGCVIGAGSLVTKNIPDFAVAVGTPAKIVEIRK